MLCPTCSKEVVVRWQPLYTHTESWGNTERAGRNILTNRRPGEDDDEREGVFWRASAEWTVCSYDECRQILIRLSQWLVDDEADEADEDGVVDLSTWLALPRAGGTRAIDPHIPAEFAADFREADQLASISPRMAAVLVRGILENLLTAEGYAGRRLADQVKAFLEDESQPRGLRALAEPLRALGDFGAHALRDEAGERIEVSQDQVEWTLTVVERLFDRFLVEPAKDAEALDQVTRMTEKANRRPLRKPPP